MNPSMPEKSVTTHKRLSSVKSMGTKPEMFVRKYLHGLGYRYSLNDKKLPGKPDIVLKKYKTIIFVHGCYWHRHEGCVKASKPKKNKMFWKEKFDKNIFRDQKVQNELFMMGWKVFVLWECELNYDLIDSMISEFNYR